MLKEALESCIKFGELKGGCEKNIHCCLTERADGDLYTALAIQIAGFEQKSAKEIADILCRKMVIKKNDFSACRVSETGFINFDFSDAFLEKVIAFGNIGNYRLPPKNIILQIHVFTKCSTGTHKVRLLQYARSLQILMQKAGYTVKLLVFETNNLLTKERKTKIFCDFSDKDCAVNFGLFLHALSEFYTIYSDTSISIGKIQETLPCTSPIKIFAVAENVEAKELFCSYSPVIAVHTVHIRNQSQCCKNWHIPSKERSNAFLFFMAQQRIQQNVVLDIALAEREDCKNPYYYVMYTYRRVLTLIKQMNIRCETLQHATPYYSSKERAIIKKILFYMELLNDVMETYEIHKLTRYAIELCKLWRSFQQSVKMEMTKLKIALCVKNILEDIFKIIGIDITKSSSY